MALSRVDVAIRWLAEIRSKNRLSLCLASSARTFGYLWNRVPVWFRNLVPEYPVHHTARVPSPPHSFQFQYTHCQRHPQNHTHSSLHAVRCVTNGQLRWGYYLLMTMSVDVCRLSLGELDQNSVQCFPVEAPSCFVRRHSRDMVHIMNWTGKTKWPWICWQWKLCFIDLMSLMACYYL